MQAFRAKFTIFWGLLIAGRGEVRPKETRFPDPVPLGLVGSFLLKKSICAACKAWQTGMKTAIKLHGYSLQEYPKVPLQHWNRRFNVD
jgi:hypothetical protein